MKVQCHRSQRTKDIWMRRCFGAGARWAAPRIAGSLAKGLPEHSVKIAPAKAADLSCQPHAGCRGSFAAHGLTVSEEQAKCIDKHYAIHNTVFMSNAAYVPATGPLSGRPHSARLPPRATYQ